MRAIEKSPILIVDDEQEVLDALKAILARAGFTRVHVLTDPRRALPVFREVRPDLVILDHHMPLMNGLDVMRQLGSRVPPHAYFPFLVISGDADVAIRQEALRRGARDFLGKPFDALEVRVRVRNQLETRRLHNHMRQLVRRRTARLRRTEREIAERLAAVAELRDYGDVEHAGRVGRLSAALARALGLPARKVELIRLAAPLHDIGKAAIPDELLMCERRLNLDERVAMMAHTTVGARLLSGTRSQLLQMAEEIALFHHENWDGSGYTPGLAGRAIPLPGRIVAVADVFDALTHVRPYKEAWPPNEALAWILSQSGKKFDPGVVKALVAVTGLTPAAHCRELPGGARTARSE